MQYGKLAMISAMAMFSDGFIRTPKQPDPPKFTPEQIKRCMEIRKPKFKRKIGR